MTTRPPVLVIDDEVQIRRLLQSVLGAQGYNVIVAETGEKGVVRAGMDRPELVVLDLGLPDIDGLEVLKKIRSWSSVPVLILSVRSAEANVIAALDAGADDYLTKPFRTGELLARVRAAMRHRPGLPEEPLFSVGDVVVDLSARTVKKKDRDIELTAIEFSLLSLFIRNAGRVLTHKYILQEVWGPSADEETQYTRVYVGHLRKKLEDDPANPKLFITESGIGYRLKAD